MKAFFKEVFQSLRSTLKWLLIVAIISGTGIVVVVVTAQWEAYQKVAHQVAQQAAAKAAQAKGGAQ
jgi:membrane protein required for beta-lactamase induction